jgi:hypothetical protein
VSERPVPLPDDASAPFWEAAARHELVVQQCARCSALTHPPRSMCPACGSFERTFSNVSGKGRVWSWVVAHPPVLPAFQDRAPYNVVVVDLDEGVRMIGNLQGEPREGLPVEVTFEDVEEGVALPQWKPI